MTGTTPHLAEIEQIEGGDDHHDFGGGHGNKGHDFAHFWMIVRVLEKEKVAAADYMFVCEYVQDIAEFDSSIAPVSVILYQLKKKETGYWSGSDLTGQTGKSKTPKVGKPVTKLFLSVHAFAHLDARGVFVSDMKFNVELDSGELSTNLEKISVGALKKEHADALRIGLAKLVSVGVDDVDLDRVHLLNVSLSVNDSERHAIGHMFSFLANKLPGHENQAQSLVEAMYVRIRGKSRETNKSQSWAELIEKRGFGKAAFQAAVLGLKSIPDASKETQALLGKLSLSWSTPEHMRVNMALTQIQRDKVLVGKGNRWDVDTSNVRFLADMVNDGTLSDAECFKSCVADLRPRLPELTDADISALAIHEMVETWISHQTPA